MARDDERIRRAQQTPVVGGLPDAPGILAAMSLTPGLGTHLRGLADEVLVHDYPGATCAAPSAKCWRRRSRQGTTASSAWTRVRRSRLRSSSAETPRTEPRLLDEIKQGSSDGFDPKMQALLHIAPHRWARLPPADRCGRRRGQGRRRHRFGRSARGPHRRGILDVQPPGRWLPRDDSTVDRGLPRAGRLHRRARISAAPPPAPVAAPAD